MKKINLLKRTILLLMTVLVSMIIAEIVISQRNPQLTYSKALDLSFNCFASDPLLPFSLKKDSDCQMKNYYNDYNVKVHINSLGYRGKDFSVSKNKDVKRILFLGDSFTFGVGVDDANTFPQQTENALQKYGYKNVQIINAGYADSFSPDSYYLYLKERGFELKPDIVVVGFFLWNDISDLSETQWEKVDKNGLPLKITSCCRIVDHDVLRNRSITLKYKYPILRDSQLFLLGMNTIEQYTQIISKNEKGDPPVLRDLNQGCVLTPLCIETFKNEEEKVRTLLQEMKKITEQNNAKFLVVLIPSDYQIFPEATIKYGSMWQLEPDKRQFIQDRFHAFFQSSQIEYIDLLPTFEKMKGVGYPFFQWDAHFNSLGSQIAGGAIAEYLHSENTTYNLPQ